MVNNSSTKRVYDLEDRTLRFAKQVIRFCTPLSQNPIVRELISQVVRSSGSIGANYREANESLGKKDFAHRLRIARKEAKETQYWLQLFEEAVPLRQADLHTLQQEAGELRKILSSIVDKVST